MPKNDEAHENADSRLETLSEGLAFLLEMGQIDAPSVKNAIILNILRLSSHIQHVELVGDQDNRRLLIYAKLGLWGRLWFRRSVAEGIIGMLQEALPTFAFRVVYDYGVFQRALSMAEKIAAQRSGLGFRTVRPS